MLLFATVVGLAGVGLMTFVCRWTRTKEDAAIGIVLSVFFGAGIVLHSVIQNLPGSGTAGLRQFLEGHAATIRDDDLIIVAGLFVVTAAVVMLLYKEFKVVSFDTDFARSQGWPTLALDLTMMGTLCLVTVMALPVVGVVLVTGMIIIPCAAARYWTQRLGRLLIVAGLMGAAAGVAGTVLSIGMLQQWLGFDPLQFGYNNKHLPTGPLIIMCGTAIFVVSLLLAPQRGVIARFIAMLRLRGKTAREHLLRSLYELNEANLPEVLPVSHAVLLGDRAWTRSQLALLTSRASGAGLIERTKAGIRLTAAGFAEAAQLTRRHRLWELFLIEGAGIAPDHVDRDADSVEHYLTPELVGELEETLAAQGRLPAAPAAVPGSPHELSGTP
jgi:manganese/zinc/iron transport system permease protein